MDRGLIVDIETTGLDSKKDQIIEIGILEFSVVNSRSPIISSTYSALEDPGIEIDPEIAKITGLDNVSLAGQKIDWKTVRSYFEKASIVVAHNANFDAAFLNRRPELEGLETHWACSIRHLPWYEMGFKSASLNYLAADHGFLNPFAHRAIFDCATTFRLIAPHLDELIKRSYEREIVIMAINSPFETKDLLKSKGYRWDPEQRCWKKSVLECDIEQERLFLQERIYAGQNLSREIPVEANY